MGMALIEHKRPLSNAAVGSFFDDHIDCGILRTHCQVPYRSSVSMFTCQVHLDVCMTHKYRGPCLARLPHLRRSSVVTLFPPSLLRQREPHVRDMLAQQRYSIPPECGSTTVSVSHPRDVNSGVRSGVPVLPTSVCHRHTLGHPLGCTLSKSLSSDKSGILRMYPPLLSPSRQPPGTP